MVYSVYQYLKALADPVGRFRTLGVPRVTPAGSFRAGNDAVVFRIESEGRTMMLKCYLRPPQAIEARCACSQRTPLTAYCQWLDRELTIDDDSGGTVEVGVTVGEWIEGRTLADEVLDAVVERDVERLGRLSAEFDRVALELLGQEWAHGDLKPENIVCSPRGMRLVDVDSIFTPELAGLTTTQLGTEGYRHPSRSELDFDRHLDDYPIALISSTLAALALDYDLYRRYDRGDGVLIDPSEAVVGTSAAVEEMKCLFARAGDAAHYFIINSLRSPLYHLDGLQEALRQAVEGVPDAEHLELAARGGRWGYVDAAGRWVILPVYHDAFEFSEGYAAVRLGDVWQYIDRHARPKLICAEAEAIKSVRSGRARLLVGGEWIERKIDEKEQESAI